MSGRLARIGTLMVGLIVPARLKPYLLNFLGHCVHPKARIKLSVLQAQRLWMAEGTHIGRFNVIRVRRLVMRTGAVIGYANVLKGHINVHLHTKGAIGNRNVISGAEPHISTPISLLIGQASKITASHKVNLNETLLIGSNSVLAGSGTQVWTHGFAHPEDGGTHPEIRGRVTIGNSVYVGAACCISPGVTIGDNITVGAHSSVATSLIEPGVYVSQPLRHIPVSVEQRLAKMPRITSPSQDVPFYWKPGGGEPGRNVVLVDPVERQ